MNFSTAGETHQLLKSQLIEQNSEAFRQDKGLLKAFDGDTRVENGYNRRYFRYIRALVFGHAGYIDITYITIILSFGDVAGICSSSGGDSAGPRYHWLHKVSSFAGTNCIPRPVN